MALFRQEVHEFFRASETILSPASLGEPLTLEEAQIVKYYVISLNKHCDGLGC